MILPWYLDSIYIFCIIYRPWRWHFKNYLYFAHSRIKKWRKIDQFGGKSKKKFYSAEFIFSKSLKQRLNFIIYTLSCKCDFLGFHLTWFVKSTKQSWPGIWRRSYPGKRSPGGLEAWRRRLFFFRRHRCRGGRGLPACEPIDSSFLIVSVC